MFITISKEGDQSCTLVKETANTGLLVSVHHRCGELANLAVVGVSRKGQAKKIYSFEEAYGGKIKAYLFII